MSASGTSSSRRPRRTGAERARCDGRCHGAGGIALGWFNGSGDDGVAVRRAEWWHTAAVRRRPLRSRARSALRRLARGRDSGSARGRAARRRAPASRRPALRRAARRPAGSPPPTATPVPVSRTIRAASLPSASARIGRPEARYSNSLPVASERLWPVSSSSASAPRWMRSDSSRVEQADGARPRRRDRPRRSAAGRRRSGGRPAAASRAARRGARGVERRAGRRAAAAGRGPSVKPLSVPVWTSVRQPSSRARLAPRLSSSGSKPFVTQCASAPSRVARSSAIGERGAERDVGALRHAALEPGLDPVLRAASATVRAAARSASRRGSRRSRRGASRPSASPTRCVGVRRAARDQAVDGRAVRTARASAVGIQLTRWLSGTKTLVSSAGGGVCAAATPGVGSAGAPQEPCAARPRSSGRRCGSRGRRRRAACRGARLVTIRHVVALRAQVLATSTPSAARRSTAAAGSST